MLKYLLCFAAALSAADNTLTPEEKKAGWKLLFDGKTLNGWDMSAKSDAYAVADGALRSTPKPKFREDIATRESFGNFELTFDWKVAPGSNSGVKYLTQAIGVVHPSFVPDTIKKFEHRLDYAFAHPQPREKMPQDGKGEIYYVAFEYQVIDNTAHSDAKRSRKSQAGALYQLIAPSEDAVKPVGEWNMGKIVVQGMRVEHWLNGKKVIDASLNDPAVPGGLEARWTKDSPVYKYLTERPKKRGPIVLQNHNDEAWYKNLKIRELK